MGDRITTYLPCPKCGKESEQYDAPTCLLWSWTCEHCGWSDKRDYYEIGRNFNNIELLTKEQAIKRKILIKCPDCGKYTLAWWIKEEGRCDDCNHKKVYVKRKTKTQKTRKRQNKT